MNTTLYKGAKIVKLRDGTIQAFWRGEILLAPTMAAMRRMIKLESERGAGLPVRISKLIVECIKQGGVA